MTTEHLTAMVDSTPDPAKQLGTLEVWNGDRRHVLRDDAGRFVTWRPADADAAAPKAVADGGEPQISFTTDRGGDVTVRAESGQLRVDVESDAISFADVPAHLDTHDGMDILDCGTRRVQGDRQLIQIPIDDRREAIEKLREESKTTAPLHYRVEEYTKTSRAGGWGKREITKQRLVPNKTVAERTEREAELHVRIDADRVPDDADVGDILTPDDLLDDARTSEEKDQDALDEAAETGEEVVISRGTTQCNDPNRECSLDRVSRVATPDGDIEARRTHTY